MELYDPKSKRYGKPYIRQAWYIAGLIDNIECVTKNDTQVNVWRLEFSLRSAVKNWIPIEIDGIEKNYQSLRNTLDCYKGRDRILVMFASLAQHYFRFKKYKKNKRKDRCPDKILFQWGAREVTYKIGKPQSALGSGNKAIENYNRLIANLRMYQQSHSLPEIFKACEVLISSMTEDNLRYDLANPWSREELETLRLMMHVRTRCPEWDYDAAMSEVKKLLAITDRTIDTF